MKRFRTSAEKMRVTRFIALCALMIAMKVALSFIQIPVAENLNIRFTYIVVAVEAAVLGPVMAVVSGAVTDIVGYLIHPTGAFFFGYTISAMAGSLIFALFLYERKITIVRLALSRFFINYLVNVLMGSYWSSVMFSKGYIYYFTNSLIKNSILLPVEVILLVIVFNALLPTLTAKQLLVPQKTPIPITGKKV